MMIRISLIFKVNVSILLLFAISADLSHDGNNGENISKLIYEFITNYKRLKFGIVFTCSREVSEDILPFNIVTKQLMRGNVTLRAVSVDDYDELNCSNFGNYAQLMRGLIAHHQFVLLDMNCPRANKVLFEASRYELFNASFHWLIIDKKASSTNDDEAPDGTGPDRLQRGQWRNCRRRSQVPPLFGRGPPAVSGGNNGSFCSDDGDEDTTTLDRLETMNISINAEITLVRESSVAGGATANGDRRRKVYALFDIWNPGFISGGQLNVTAMGNYVVDNAGGGRLTVWFHQSTVVRRRDMRGLKLKIMTVVTQRPGIPFEVYLATPNNTHLDSVHRYNFGLMSYIRDYFNFSFIMRRTKSWGYLRNGTFDGMIGALSRREVDLGGSPMFFRQERHRVVSYTTRSFMERPCFIFRHPKRQSTMRNPFLLPFETVIWYLMVFCGALLVVVLFASYHFEESENPPFPAVSAESGTSGKIFTFVDLE
ncbi:uncharacterized protein LOC6042858 [Culex quinquefasciatus]|uniref:uncharacterized protein LOC6042858 n=1 Tax=Culex quinquefasciatus TaxID=7176 RepID=UPI0018E3CBBD|nr:uncharacterized protein LOC6042858 [Culex quinquefasciatus]